MKEEPEIKIWEDLIIKKIYRIREVKVMLDSDLADLYGVTTGNLNKAVKRNIIRFPTDFMFQLTTKEIDDLIFQIGRASWGGRRTPPFVFSEQGVAMLSGILNSNRAIKVNIQIMRVFTKIKAMLQDHKEILKKLEIIEKKDVEQDDKIILIFKYLKQLEATRQDEVKFKERDPMGFKQRERKV